VTTENTGNKGVSLRFARIALILAAVIAMAAVVIAIVRSRTSGESALPGAPVSPSPTVPDIASMIGGLEKKMADHPDDPKGWILLGQAYYHVGRYKDAVAAYSKAAALEPANATTWSALGEVQLLSGRGGVTPEAEASFRKALALDAKDFRARYFIAVKKNDSGDHRQAVDDLIAILQESPADAPWTEPVRELTMRLAKQYDIDISGRIPRPPAAAASASGPSGGSVATGAIPGPSASDLKAATAMTPAEQDAMARSMVDRLAARLRDNPRDADRWIMLMRARMVLNDGAGAKAALIGAKAAFAGDRAQLARFDEAAAALGIR